MVTESAWLGGAAAPLAISGAALVSPAGRGFDVLFEALAARRACFTRFVDERLTAAKSASSASFVPPIASARDGFVAGWMDDAQFARRGRSQGADPATSSDPRRGAAEGTAAHLADAAELFRNTTFAALDAAELAPASAGVGVTVATALGGTEGFETWSQTEPQVAHAGRAARPIGAIASLLGASTSGRSLMPPAALFSATCVSGLAALESAAADLAFRRRDAVVVSAADTLSASMVSGFRSLRAVSESGRLRPFAADADGVVIGEAACAVVLEPLDALTQRGGSARAFLLAQRLVSDGYHLTTPNPDGSGMKSALRQALTDAEVDRTDVGCIVFTATGSPVYDRMLASTVEEVFGASAAEIPVTSWEVAIGHVLAASGTLAVGFAARLIGRREVPGMYPLAADFEHAALRVVRETALPLEADVVVVLVVGFGGQNGAVVVAGEEFVRRRLSERARQVTCVEQARRGAP